MRNQKSIAPPLALATMLAAILVTTGFGTYAALIAEVSNLVPKTVTAGNLIVDLTDDGAGFTAAVTGLAPGDVVNRHVSLTNTGTIQGSTVSLEISVSGAVSLISNGTTSEAVTLAVNSCSVAWVPATGFCSGTTTELRSAIPLGDFSSAVLLSSDSFDPSEIRYLQFSLSLPDQDETTVNGVVPIDTVQGKTVTITYKFIVLQRTATTVNQ